MTAASRHVPRSVRAAARARPPPATPEPGNSTPGGIADAEPTPTIIRSIYGKLHVRSKTEAVREAMRLGYVRMPAD